MSENASDGTTCSKCDKHIEECAVCEEPECGQAICFGCLNVTTGQQMTQPHAHGG